MNRVCIFQGAAQIKKTKRQQICPQNQYNHKLFMYVQYFILLKFTKTTAMADGNVISLLIKYWSK